MAQYIRKKDFQTLADRHDHHSRRRSVALLQSTENRLLIDTPAMIFDSKQSCSSASTSLVKCSVSITTPVTIAETASVSTTIRSRSVSLLEQQKQQRLTRQNDNYPSNNTIDDRRAEIDNDGPSALIVSADDRTKRITIESGDNSTAMMISRSSWSPCRLESEQTRAARGIETTTTTSSTATATTTITTYNEINENSDHPNVDCRIPELVNAKQLNDDRDDDHGDEKDDNGQQHSMFYRSSNHLCSSSLVSTTLSRLKVNDRCRTVRKNYDNSGLWCWWQLILAIYSIAVYIMSTSTIVCWAARQEVASNCSFPQRWEGTWFLSGYQQSVHIRGSQFSYRGKCAASDGNKYLIVDESGCHRCLVIYEKHKNVLQFKESECEGDNMYGDQSNPAAMQMRSVVKSDHRGGAHPNLNGHARLSSSDQYIMRSNDDSNDCNFCKRRETLVNLCDQIPGDALLYSLFRENAEPVKCPLKGPFSFTYNRGHGECKSPVSNIESCTEESRLLLSFQACTDVLGTESTVEELTCLATWKDGNSRYLIGLVSQHHTHHLQTPHHALSNEERYRCFVYEKISTMMGPLSNQNIKDAEYKLAQSGDATCNGLDSAEVGSRIMTLRKPPPAERCDFPAWLKGPRHWRALIDNIGYSFHQSDGSMHISIAGVLQTRALCEQINKQTQTEMMAVVHYTSQCESGFMCMTFYKRDLQVAEIQMGSPASRLEDACAPDHFDITRLSYVTLLASNPESQICPLEGLFSLRGTIGPPPNTQSRHKRNHNNNNNNKAGGHNPHGHHHHEQGHKRHGIQSFRNSEEVGQTSWQSHTRGLSIRKRRSAVGENLATTTVAISNDVADNLRYDLNRAGVMGQGDSRISIGHIGNRANTKFDEEELTQLRNRRDAPTCVINKNHRQLLSGCSDANIIEVRPRCNDNGEETYLCHGSWFENNTMYIVAKNQATLHGVCISYRQLDGVDSLMVVGDTCYRGLQKPPSNHFVANLTITGKCGDTSTANSIHPKNNWIQLSILTMSIVLVVMTTATISLLTPNPISIFRNR